MKIAHRTLKCFGDFPKDVVAVALLEVAQAAAAALGTGVRQARRRYLAIQHPDGSPIPPSRLTRRWQDACASLDLPRVSFHALRHTHDSALIAAGVDVVVISRRLGHANPTVTLNIYGHLFKKDDGAAAVAIEAALRYGREG